MLVSSGFPTQIIIHNKQFKLLSPVLQFARNRYYRVRLGRSTVNMVFEPIIWFFPEKNLLYQESLHDLVIFLASAARQSAAQLLPQGSARR